MIKKIGIISLFLASLLVDLDGAVFTNIKIRNISDDATNTVIMWTNITAISQNWIVADQYVPVEYLTNHAVITGWGIQIYTHNRTNIANPMYKGTNNPASLVDTTFSNYLLPMAWLIKTNKSRPPKPKERIDHTGFSNFDWHYLSDRKSPGFTNEKDYFIPWNQGGIAWHEAVRAMKPLKGYLYFAANFLGLFITKYQTSQLRVEEYNNSDGKFLPFYIYKDGWHDWAPMPNHYFPAKAGRGDMNAFWTTNPHSGAECIQVNLTNNGGWSAWHYLEPEGNWNNSGKQIGYDLTGATKLTFWVRGQNGGESVCFKMGYATDSCGEIKVDGSNVNGYLTLTTSWSQKRFTLTGYNLSYVHVGFLCGVWASTATFYLDDIRYEK